MPTDTSRRLARLGATVLLVALAAAGCTHHSKGGGAGSEGAGAPTAAKPAGAEAKQGPPNGLERKTAAEVQRAAAATLKNAKSVHVTFTGPRQPLLLDLRIQGNASSGTVAIASAGASFQVTSIGRDTWIKGDDRALRALGIPGAARQRVAGHWFKAPGQQVAGLGGFSLDSLASGVGRNESPLQKKVEQTLLDGRKVIVLTQKNGAKLYISNTGPAFPLRTDLKASGSGRVVFSEYGVDFHITAPVDVVDLNVAG
ncbi:MAG TPA: hypothetical protein VF486_04615 [Actinomycetes bacterium]|jgi:hypothetical protein